jgi:hypothetical protein
VSATFDQSQSIEVQIVAFPIGNYRDESRNPRFDADNEATALTDMLADELGGVVRPWSVPSHRRDLAAVEARLQDWARPTTSRSSVLVWVGHGTSNDSDATLVVPGAEKSRADAELLPETLARRLRDEYRRRFDDAAWAVVIVEACGAGRFVQLTASELLRRDPPEGLLLIGVGDPTGRGHLAAARGVLAAVFAQYTDNDTRIRLGDLADRIGRKLSQSRGWVQPLGMADRAIVRPAPTVVTTLDVYAKLRDILAGRPTAEDAHYVRKGMGADFGELAWRFVGRDRELSRISRWLDATTSGMLVVTGRAGTGKSAILGNLLIRARPAMLDLFTKAGLMSASPAGSVAERAVVVDACVHLTGMTSTDVAIAIADAAQVSLPASRSSVSVEYRQITTDLVTALSNANTSLTLLVDAVDEAAEPLEAASLIRDVSVLQGIRIVVGTRASTKEGPDQTDPGETDLLDALGQDSPTTAVLTIQRDSNALDTYVRQQLAASDGTSVDAATLDHIAAQISALDSATGLAREFLFARLALYEIRADPEVLRQDRRPDLDALLVGNHSTLFEAALKRLRRARPIDAALLTTLAFAHGRGLPRADKIWAVAGGAVARTVIADDDLDHVIDRAAPYIMLDCEDGQSVYRLAHRTFQEHFINSSDHPKLARNVCKALIVAADSVDVEDADLNPYLVRHLAEHAAQLGLEGWHFLAEHPRALDQIDPDRVATEAMRRGFGSSLPPEILGVVRASHILREADVRDRAGLRQLSMAHLGVSQLTGREAEGLDAWAVMATALRHESVSRTLTGHAGSVEAMALLVGLDGRQLLATASSDGTVRVWDPVAGTAVGGPLTGHKLPVTAVVSLVGPDGRPLLATGETDRTAKSAGEVRVWDPVSGTAVGGPLIGHELPVMAMVSLAGSDGRQLLATGESAGKVRVWDPVAGACLATAGLAMRIFALVPLESDLIVASSDGWARIRFALGVRMR